MDPTVNEGGFTPPCAESASRSGISADFIYPEALWPATVGIGVASCTLAALFTAARVYVNFKSLRLADFCALAATVIMFGLTSTTITRK